MASIKQHQQASDDEEEAEHVQKLQQDKQAFIKAALHGQDADLAAALKGKTSIPNVVSLPVKKRDAEESIDELEGKARQQKQGNKKQKRR